MSRPELARTSPRRPRIVAILFPSGDQAAEVAATEKRSAPRSSTTWMRPSYAPVANNPVVDHPTGWPPLETFHTCIPVGVYASTAPTIATVTSPPSGDHAGWKSVAARATARGWRPFPASQSVTVSEAAPPVVYASVRLSGAQAISTAYCEGKPFDERRRSPRPSVPIVHTPPPSRSLTNATSFPFGETTGIVSCQGLCVRFVTRPLASTR
jgi:hypothetical protein